MKISLNLNQVSSWENPKAEWEFKMVVVYNILVEAMLADSKASSEIDETEFKLKNLRLDKQLPQESTTSPPVEENSFHSAYSSRPTSARHEARLSEAQKNKQVRFVLTKHFSKFTANICFGICKMC